MQNSKIQWTDHTVNFWWGCTKVSEACRHCYAERVAEIFGAQVFGTAPEWRPGKPRAPRLERATTEALAYQRKAAKHGTLPKVFVNSMSDWLDAEVPSHWLATLLEVIGQCPTVIFQLLTKRPQNWQARMEAVVLESAAHAAEVWPHAGADIAQRWLTENTPPPNVWLGTTVEDQKAADARIPALLTIPAAIRFLSCEPLLGRISLLTRADHSRMGALYAEETLATSSTINFEPRIHWVIAGGESGGQARASHPTWFYDLRDQCTAAGVPFFFKQWGEWLPSGAEAAHLPDTKTFKPDRFRDGLILLHTGVKLAGRKLQGREWNEMPIQP